MTERPPLDLRVGQLLRIRAKRKALKEAAVKADLPFAELERLVSDAVMEHIKELGVDSAKTEAGTVFLSTKRTASLADADAFMKYVIGTGQFDLLDRKANVTAITDHLKEHNELPPGVNYHSFQTLNVRSPKGGLAKDDADEQ
jgi:hypothetical protein